MNSMPPVVMVVDDSLLVRQQVRRALADAGFEVVEAVDGVDALERMRNANVSLVICDVNMPRMSGIEFLEGLGAARESVAVVILTTDGQPQLVRRAQSLGAKGWITKPFKPELLVATARKLTAGCG